MFTSVAETILRKCRVEMFTKCIAEMFTEYSKGDVYSEHHQNVYSVVQKCLTGGITEYRRDYV